VALLEIFDVEHGQCALFTHPNGNRILIDCGHNSTTGFTPGWLLQSRGIQMLNKLVVTNYDEDHVSGFIDLDQRVYIDWLMRNCSVDGNTMYLLKSESGIGRNMAHFANRVGAFARSDGAPMFPGVSEEAYCHAYPAFFDENNLSLVYVLRIYGTTVIFPGDMECAGWERLLAEEPGLQRAVNDCRLLVASHHGRESGICDWMFSRYGCSPDAIVISDDRFRYDTQATTRYYASKCRGVLFRGASRYVLTTRSDGYLQFAFSPLAGMTCG
jgi:beta-lactamase superfamily II metal-dependent hydrolase